MRRRLVAISSFLLATGLGVSTLTDSSVSLAAPTESPSGLANQRALVERLQAATRARREEEVLARARQAAAEAAAAEDARRAAEAAAAARDAAARAARAARPSPPSTGPVDWKALVAQYPWDVTVAERVLWCESRGDPNAHNAGANGLFQILGGPFDPVANVALAYRMYSARGWQPWTSSRRCWS
jgi:hypothetical protein